MSAIGLIKINIARFKTNLNFPGDILARYKKRNSTFTFDRHDTDNEHNSPNN